MVTGSPAVKGDGFYISENNQYFNDAAIFAEGHYNITPKLKFTGGIRYFWTDLNDRLCRCDGHGGQHHHHQEHADRYHGCPVPLPDKRLTCRNTNLLDPRNRALQGTGRDAQGCHQLAVRAVQDGLFQLFDRLPSRRLQPPAALRATWACSRCSRSSRKR
jgi:hypothetical protein